MDNTASLGCKITWGGLFGYLGQHTALGAHFTARLGLLWGFPLPLVGQAHMDSLLNAGHFWGHGTAISQAAFPEVGTALQKSAGRKILASSTQPAPGAAVGRLEMGRGFRAGVRASPAGATLG